MKRVLLALLIFIMLFPINLQSFGSATISPIVLTTSCPEDVTIYFLDVGQGDSILVKTPSKNILIDGGPTSAGTTVLNDLNAFNVTKIDLMVATHPHEDHIGGLIAVLQSTIPTQDIIYNGYNHTTQTYNTWKTLALARNLTQASRNQVYAMSPTINFTILSPTNPLQFSDINAGSIVMRLQVGNTSILFTGDGQFDTEQSVLSSGYNLHSQVLKVGHHGSSTSTSQAFLSAVTPTYAVISAGINNQYGHPTQQTLDILASNSIITYGTYIYGTIVFSLTSATQTPTLALEGVTAWYWTADTNIDSVASGDVDNDGFSEIVTGGYYFDGTRTNAQLVVWNGSNLAVDRLTGWFWTGNTTINSIALGDVDGDGQVEIVTGGSFFDGSRKVAQLIEWNGANLAVDRVTSWYWTGNTMINSVAIENVDGDAQVEIVTGGYYNDGARNVAQLIEWNGSNLAVDRLTCWYWSDNTVINSVALGDVDSDAQVEVVTGGYYNNGVRGIAQLIEWSGASLTVDRLTGWYWTGNTAINSVAVGDADGDGQTEVVTGGYYNDGARGIAQLIEWDGANLSVDRLTGWYWTNNTVINSVAIGDVDADGQTEVVSGGYFNDNARNIAQLIEWNGATLAVDRLTGWYWTSNTSINLVAAGEVDNDYNTEVVTGGTFYDGTRLNSQLTVWGIN